MFTPRLWIKGMTWCQIFTCLLFLTSIYLFITTYRPTPFQHSISTWILLLSMVGTTFVLDFFTFQLPPTGSKQSMDSAVYLACVFMYDISFALSVLLLNALFFAIYERKVTLKKHLINFSIYAITLICAASVYYWAGGTTGAFENHHLLAYALSLTIYFTVNTLSIGMYYYLQRESQLRITLKSLFKESLKVYACTMILSVVLTVLVVHNGIIGLLLFTGLSILLSRSYIQMFNLYLQTEERTHLDQRTGLYTHSFFEDSLEKELTHSIKNDTNLSIAMIDIDDFKIYNDHYGHLIGDKLLAFVGQYLKKECNAVSAIASRYGGEEFTILLPGYDSHRAFLFINSLRKKLNDIYIEGVELLPHHCLSFSAGIASVHMDIHHKSDLVDRAVQALVYAKNQGKNSVHIHGNIPKMKPEIDISQEVRDIEQQLSLFMYKDITTYTHSKRVFQYAIDMSEILQLDSNFYRKFVLGALIHDIGKIEIPRELLHRAEKLTSNEWNQIKNHVTWGKEIVLSQEKFKDLAPFAELHHERYDGKGYPHGFKNEEIPWLCRMLTIIDSFDAMTSERPYQRTKTIPEAISELRVCSGSQFDPVLTELFIGYIESKNDIPLS